MDKNENSKTNIKKKLKNNLYKILSNIEFFFKNIKESNINQEEINNILFSHPISQKKNLNKIKTFLDMLNNLKETTLNTIIELQEESEMRQKKRNEIKDLNNFLNTNLKFLENKDKNNNLLLPSDEIKDELKEKKEDDILVEDTKDIEKEKQNLLNKKREKEVNPKERKKIFNLLCYICKKKLKTNNISKFYGRLCQKCGDYNYSFRTMKLDLTGRIAIVTGGRVKIGFHIVKKLLSYGCKVITTTRFPNDALLRFKAEHDYDIWKNNLMIYPIDFRIFQSTVNFVNYIKNNFTHIDFLINNAAQTIRRSTEYYEYLIPNEIKKLSDEDNKNIIKTEYIELKKQISENLDKNKNIDNIDINKKEQIENNFEKKELFNSLVSLMKKDNKINEEILPLSVIASQIKIMEEKEHPHVYVMGSDGQPYDFTKGKSSWNFELDEIPFQEFTEVQIINAWTPYYLCAKLKPMLNKSPFKDKYIINVTAFEGIFNHKKKSTHVHTNMAKAALNMLTRTCGKYLEKENIYMTCVDTSWVSYMNEMNKIMDDETKEDCEFEMACVPLDELDGAMRVLHPIIEGIKNKKYFSGVLLKDYTISNW